MPDTAITLHGFPFSTYTRSALLACQEKGVTYTLTPARMRSPAYGELHPWRKMPVLEHGAFRVYEAAAVLRYIDEAFDGPALQPATAAGRARMTQWMSAFNDYVMPYAVRGVLIPRFVLPMRGLEADPAAVATATTAARDALAPFDRALADQPFLAGEALSLADLLVVPALSAARLLEGEECYLTGHDNVLAWLARMEARPSFSATAA